MAGLKWYLDHTLCRSHNAIKNMHIKGRPLDQAMILFNCIIWKLHQYGIRGNALSWIQAFLGNRSQTVVIEGEESGSVPVSSGVPQGSVLGPILFLVFINDLPEKLSSQVRLFADDTAVYLTIGGLDDGTLLQNDLDKLSLWESQWDMEFKPL